MMYLGNISGPAFLIHTVIISYLRMVHIDEHPTLMRMRLEKLHSATRGIILFWMKVKSEQEHYKIMGMKYMQRFMEKKPRTSFTIENN